MSLNLKEKQSFTIDDFSGGLNESSSSNKITDKEIVSIKNLSLKTDGAMTLRTGTSTVEPLVTDQVFSDTDIRSAVRNLYRYVRSDGTKSTLAFDADSYLWVTDSTGQFVNVGSNFEFATIDGYQRFAQYYDTVLFGSDKHEGNSSLNLYNSDVDSTSFSKANVLSGNVNFNSTYSMATSGGEVQDNKFYYYRFTVDWGYGEFIAESSPLYVAYSGNHIKYLTLQVDTGSGGADENVIQIKKAGSGSISDHLGMTADRIHIYRDGPYDSARDKYQTEKDEYLHVGSLSVDDYNAAAASDVIFEDGGLVVGVAVEYNKMEKPPCGRFLVLHKNRIWLGNVQYLEGPIEAWANSENGTLVTAPHRVFISSINNHGSTEPIAFYTDQWVDIHPFGEGITGMWSYHNEVLVIFHANSMWAITGDDPTPRTGNINIRNISMSVGCIAPNTICEIEGRLTWLSNSGPYIWDGGGKPQPLKADNIEDTVRAIPDLQKNKACSIYDMDNRQLLFAHAGPLTGGHNKIMSVFDLRTGSWTRYEYPLGIGSFVAKAQPNETVEINAGIGDEPSFFVSSGAAVLKLNDGTYTDQGPSSLENISFSFETKRYSHGSPFMDKNFVAMLFELQTKTDLPLDIVIDDIYDSQVDPENDLEVNAPTANDNLTWSSSSGAAPPGSDEAWYHADNPNRWAVVKPGTSLVRLNTKMTGKRIGMIVIGTPTSEMYIESITVFYEPKEGVRE